MARYQHLPVYRLTYELLQHLMMVLADFPKQYKFTVGQKLQDEVIEMVVLIYRANAAKETRALEIEKFLEKLQVVELMIRLSQDMRILSKKHYASLIAMTQALGKQAQGWKRASTQATSS